jgi:hypothetical protein
MRKWFCEASKKNGSQYGENTHSSRSIVATNESSVGALPQPTGVSPRDSRVSHCKRHEKGSIVMSAKYCIF